MIPRYSRPAMDAIWSESGKFARWLRVEIAVTEAWGALGAVPPEAVARVREATYDPDRMAALLEVTHHDMTAFLGSVTERLGPEGRFLHKGLTTSDVWDTATALQLRDAADLLAADVVALGEVLERRALEYKSTPMMGRTHGVHAEPTTFGLKLLLWVDEMRRNARRLAEARDVIAVGKISGPVGTHATAPPELEERALARLDLGVAPVSNQVVQRDRHAQFVTTLAIIAASLEKFATEIRGLQRTEVREVEEPFAAGQTGSSSMPHKRNPELCERICGLSRLLRGYTVTALENVALWHERDISHSSAERLILPDACLALDYSLDLFTGVMGGLRVFPERMRENIDATRGLVFSHRVLLALVDSGLAREVAYGIVQRHALRAWDEGCAFRASLEGDPEVAERLPPEALDVAFDLGSFTRYVDETFRRLGLASEGGVTR